METYLEISQTIALWFIFIQLGIVIDLLKNKGGKK